MALARKTVVDQIEIRRDGTIQVRLGLLVMDGDAEIHCQWHRTAIEPGGDVDEQIAAVNAHLESMGQLPVPNDDLKPLKDVKQVIHTPGVVKAYQDRVAALADARAEEIGRRVNQALQGR